MSLILRHNPEGGTKNFCFSTNDSHSESLHKQSHGESFLSVVENRFFGRGIYIPEAPEKMLGELFE